MTAAFRPPPGLANPHVQTLLGQVLSGVRFCRPSRERHVALPDGDRLVLLDSVPPQWRPGGRVALLLHGLGGNALSPHVGRVGRKLLHHGMRVLRLNLRGAGSGAVFARRRYHAGLTGDVRAVTEELQRWVPGSPLTLIGFSLGGNLALKLAGEAAEEPVPGLERVAVIGPPIDLSLCCGLLGLPRNRFYERYYLNLLLRQQREWRRLVPGLPELAVLPTTLRGYDDQVVAPEWGFAGADDYYRRATALPVIPRIGVPTLILTARDDPFIAVEPFEQLRVPSHVELRIERHGGHLRFVFGGAAPGLTWADECLVRWVLAR